MGEGDPCQDFPLLGIILQPLEYSCIWGWGTLRPRSSLTSPSHLFVPRT